MPAFTEITLLGTPTPGQTTTIAANGASYAYTAKVGDSTANILKSLAQMISAALNQSQSGHAAEPYLAGVASDGALRMTSTNLNFAVQMSGSTTDSALTLASMSGAG